MEIIADQNATRKTLRSKYEIRDFLEDIKFYMAEKYSSIHPDFVYFRSVYFDASNKEKRNQLKTVYEKNWSAKNSYQIRIL